MARGILLHRLHLDDVPDDMFFDFVISVDSIWDHRHSGNALFTLAAEREDFFGNMYPVYFSFTIHQTTLVRVLLWSLANENDDIPELLSSAVTEVRPDLELCDGLWRLVCPN